MQTPIIKSYKVLTRQNSRWYKIILLIQQGKTSAMYIIKTQDREVLETLSSTCLKEVRDKIQFVSNLILGKPQSSPTSILLQIYSFRASALLMHNEELSHKLHFITQFQILWNTHHTPTTEENEISSSLYTLPLSAYTWHWFWYLRSFVLRWKKNT